MFFRLLYIFYKSFGFQEEFLQVLSDTVIGNKYICMECILKADPYYPKYIRGQIQFGLNFIEISPENVEEGYSFCSVFYCSV